MPRPFVRCRSPALACALALAGTAGPASAGEGGDSCSELVYLIDESYRLLSFDPRRIGLEDPFTLIGSLSCPASASPVPGWPGVVAPYSLAIDRSGGARVLYTSGELFSVDVSDASCATTAFEPEQGNQWLVFQQAFATNVSGGAEETQYVGGGSVSEAPGGLFGSLDPSTLEIQTLGTLPNDGEFSPSLTGIGDGTLFGFYPGAATAFVQQIDKSTGAAVGGTLPMPGGLAPTPVAWAFAHWGGAFWVFATTLDTVTQNLHTAVRRIDRATGAYAVVLANVPYVFTAAGVSTCAPLSVPEPEAPALASLVALLLVARAWRRPSR